MNINQESDTLTIIARMCQLLPFVRGFQSSSCYRFIPQIRQHNDFRNVFKVLTPTRTVILEAFKNQSAGK
jgi:hypothetical protein